MCRGYIATQDPLPALLMISGGWFGNRVHTTVMLTQVVPKRERVSIALLFVCAH